MSNSNNAVNGDMDKNRNGKTKNSKKTSKSNISASTEGINAAKPKSTQSHKEQTENSTLQKKKSVSKNGNDQQVKFADKEIENKLKTEYEERAKAEAERKAQSILKQAEDKARQEAERRSKEIAKEAEDKARQEAERRSKEIAKNLEHLPEEERIDFDINGHKGYNNLINPFSTGINLWQSYSRMWVNFYKETINNTAKLTKDLGKPIRNGFVKNT
jgi:hypothetical protein